MQVRESPSFKVDRQVIGPLSLPLFIFFPYTPPQNVCGTHLSKVAPSQKKKVDTSHVDYQPVYTRIYTHTHTRTYTHSLCVRD